MSRWWYTKLIFIILLGLGAFVLVWPSLESMVGVKCPAIVKNHVHARINRGLDLRGGLRLVYTVQVDEAIGDRRNHYADDMRQRLAGALGLHKGDNPLTSDEQKTLATKVNVERPENNKILLRFTDVNDAKVVDDKFREPIDTELIQYSPEQGNAKAIGFKVRAEVENGIRERAVGQAKKTVENRVDELGLREAAITTRDEDIIIEVPGEDEKTFKEIEDIVAQTARLEFKILDDEGDYFGKLNTTEHALPLGGSMQSELAPAGLTPSGSVKQVPTHYVRVVQQPNESTAQALRRARDWVASLGMPDDHQVGWGHDADPVTHKPMNDTWRSYVMYRRADVTGEYITDAQVSVDTNKGPTQEYYVAITFSPTGADRFKEVTAKNIKKRFAILLDDQVDSAPVIQSEIGGGHASITLGSFNDRHEQLEAAKKLELVLRAGALPASITLSNRQFIGASLGSDAVSKGLKGAAFGAGLVLIFMVVYYRKAGLIADGAVLFNLLLQLAALAGFGASMTLPGIAGLALTIGMAVDANVLINERIREELREGRSPRAAVETGYSKAFSAVFDGHVTTFIGGLLMLQYGTGPIKGFAVTLIIGIVASLFTAVVCTRVVFDYWVLGLRSKKLSLGGMTTPINQDKGLAPAE